MSRANELARRLMGEPAPATESIEGGSEAAPEPTAEGTEGGSEATPVEDTETEPSMNDLIRAQRHGRIIDLFGQLPATESPAEPAEGTETPEPTPAQRMNALLRAHRRPRTEDETSSDA